MESKNTIYKSIISLIFVALGYSLLNIAARLLNDGFEPMTQTYLRILIGFLFSLILFRKQIDFKKISKITAKDWGVLIVMGTFGYSIGVFFITQGAINTNLLNVSVIYSTIVFFAYIYSILFLKEKFDWRIGLLILVSLIGVSFISAKSFSPTFSSFGKGDIFVLIAAAMMSLYSVGRQALSKLLNNQEITSLTMLIAVICGITIAIIRGETLTFGSFANVNVLIGLGLGAFLNIITSYLEMYSFNNLKVVLGNQILLSENIFSALLGYFLYKEKLGIPEIIGSIIVVFAVVVTFKIQEKK